MNDYKNQIRKLQNKEISIIIKRDKEGLFRFIENFNLKIFKDKELVEQLLQISDALESDIEEIKKENKLLKKENKKLKKYMLNYKNRLEKISKSNYYKLYQIFKKIIQGE